MIKLLLVGDANSIVLVEYTKAIKRAMDVEVSIYSPFPDRGNYTDYPYDHVYFDDFVTSKFGRMKIIGYQSRFFAFNRRLHNYLKRENKKYDIIHIQWLLPSWTITPRLYHKYSKKLVLSFWGGEMESQKILFSSGFYQKCLGKLLSISDAGIGTTSFVNTLVLNKYPFIKEKRYYGLFGSSIVSEMIKLQEKKNCYRTELNIPNDKITVLLGYSGKEIHNHLLILEELRKHEAFGKIKDNIHFLAPMTRGAKPQYIVDVEKALNDIGSSYTLIKNCYQSDKDVACLRLSTDIVFQLSHHDQVSASIIENLAAGALMICGNWFPNYDVLRNYGFEWIEVEGIKEGVYKFYEILPEMDKYYGMTNHNQSVGKSKFAWDECIKDWVNAYKNILKS